MCITFSKSLTIVAGAVLAVGTAIGAIIGAVGVGLQGAAYSRQLQDSDYSRRLVDLQVAVLQQQLADHKKLKELQERQQQERQRPRYVSMPKGVMPMLQAMRGMPPVAIAMQPIMRSMRTRSMALTTPPPPSTSQHNVSGQAYLSSLRSPSRSPEYNLLYDTSPQRVRRSVSSSTIPMLTHQPQDISSPGHSPAFTRRQQLTPAAAKIVAGGEGGWSDISDIRSRSSSLGGSSTASTVAMFERTDLEAPLITPQPITPAAQLYKYQPLAGGLSPVTQQIRQRRGLHIAPQASSSPHRGQTYDFLAGTTLLCSTTARNNEKANAARGSRRCFDGEWPKACSG